MGAYRGLTETIFPDIVAEAEAHNYSDANILILKGNKDEFVRRYPDTYNAIISCFHNFDTRYPFEYARDLVANWLLEDWIVKNLRERGIDIRLNGADKQRMILFADRISGHSDTTVTIGGKKRDMEISANFTGYWQRTGKVDLRDNKYNNLRDNGCLLFGLDARNRKFFLLDVERMNNAVVHEEEHEAWGGKPCSSIILTPFDLAPFSFNALEMRLREVFDHTPCEYYTEKNVTAPISQFRQGSLFMSTGVLVKEETTTVGMCLKSTDEEKCPFDGDKSRCEKV